MYLPLKINLKIRQISFKIKLADFHNNDVQLKFYLKTHTKFIKEQIFKNCLSEIESISLNFYPVAVSQYKVELAKS